MLNRLTWTHRLKPVPQIRLELDVTIVHRLTSGNVS